MACLQSSGMLAKEIERLHSSVTGVAKIDAQSLRKGNKGNNKFSQSVSYDKRTGAILWSLLSFIVLKWDI